MTRKLSAYNKFVKAFAKSHKGQFRSGKALIRAAAKSYKKSGSKGSHKKRSGSKKSHKKRHSKKRSGSKKSHKKRHSKKRSGSKKSHKKRHSKKH